MHAVHFADKKAVICVKEGKGAGSNTVRASGMGWGRSSDAVAGSKEVQNLVV